MSKRGAVSGDELRGILRTAEAIEKAREAERRKQAMVKKQVQPNVHDFIVGTNGVYYAGSLIKLSPADLRLVTKKQRRIDEMKAVQKEYQEKGDGAPKLFKQDLIDHAERELKEILTNLDWASKRAPESTELTDDLSETRPREGVWDRVKRGFGMKPKPTEKRVEIEVVED